MTRRKNPLPTGFQNVMYHDPPLPVHLVPKPLWGSNLRQRLGRHFWNKEVRRPLISRAGLTCHVCGSKADQSRNMNAHEDWDYFVVAGRAAAQLAAIELICRKCHEVHHFGRLTRVVAEGRAPDDAIEAAIDHWCRVNNRPKSAFDPHFASALDDWRAVSVISLADWHFDWGPFTKIVFSVDDRRAELAGFDAYCEPEPGWEHDPWHPLNN